MDEDKIITIMETLIKQHQKRIEELENKVKELESAVSHFRAFGKQQ